MSVSWIGFSDTVHVSMAYVWAAWRLCRVEIHMLETPEEILVPLEIPKSEQMG